jgi:hypothetical protein
MHALAATSKTGAQEQDHRLAVIMIVLAVLAVAALLVLHRAGDLVPGVLFLAAGALMTWAELHVHDLPPAVSFLAALAVPVAYKALRRAAGAEPRALTRSHHPPHLQPERRNDMTMLQKIGRALHTTTDNEAIKNGLEITERQGGLARRYRDPRFDGRPGQATGPVNPGGLKTLQSASQPPQ